jgi:HK97 gp10 family phage protein
MDRINADASRAVKGIEDLERKLRGSFIRKSLRASTKPTAKLATSTAPEKTGLMKSQIKTRSGGVKKGTYKMTVGVSKKNFTGTAFYFAFEIFGHRVGKRELGDARKMVPKNDFMDKAYEATANGSIEIFRETITDFIDSV